ncbi:MAG: TonB-dependent receptor, partial [Holophagales bacterium]|nr:TonB-dependent receptor [Holophagales bacterium]
MVTARKREENVRDVPVAITVLGGDQLEESAAADLSAIQTDVPNLSVYSARNQSSTLTAFLRGVGQAEPLWGVDPGVGLYLDGVYMARAQGALLDVFDVERVEVLRGPQGTLYGKNTIGGAVKYVSRPLGDEFEGSLRLTAGEHGTAEVRAAAGGALVPGKLRARVAFASLRRAGYGRNLFTGRDVSDKDTNAFRLGLDWLPSERGIFRLRFDRTDDDSEPKGHTRLAANPFCPAFNGTPCPPLPDLFDTEAGQEPRNGTESTGVSLTVDRYLADHWTFRSITAVRESDTLNYQDFDTTPASIVEAGSSYSDEQFSQEFQLVYDRGDSLSGVLGLFYFNGRAGGEIRQLIFGNHFSTLGGEVHTDSIALFGDGSYALGERLSLHFGLRITEETKRGISFNAEYADQTFTEITGVIS